MGVMKSATHHSRESVLEILDFDLDGIQQERVLELCKGREINVSSNE